MVGGSRSTVGGGRLEELLGPARVAGQPSSDRFELCRGFVARPIATSALSYPVAPPRC